MTSINQRPAIRSYSTTGSLRLPDRPQCDGSTVLQKLFRAVGPAAIEPVALSKTANETFTVSATWVAPTAALVSGGAYCTVKPGKPLPSPRTLRPGGVLTMMLAASWGAPSSPASAEVPGRELGICGRGRTIGRLPDPLSSGMVRMGAERP